MGFKRLFGVGETGDAIEVDTHILGPALPGGELRGEVLLRGGRRDTYIDYVDLHVHVRCTDHDGRQSTYEIDTHSAEPGRLTLRKGEERRLTFSQRLPWETPPSELGGRALGVALSVRSRITRGDGDDGIDVDDDLLHVSALPLHGPSSTCSPRRATSATRRRSSRAMSRAPNSVSASSRPSCSPATFPARTGRTRWRSPSRRTPSAPWSTSGAPRPTSGTGRTSRPPAASRPPIMRSAPSTGGRRSARC